MKLKHRLHRRTGLRTKRASFRKRGRPPAQAPRLLPMYLRRARDMQIAMTMGLPNWLGVP